VEAQARDHDEGVAAVRVDGDPLSLPGRAEALELARVLGLVEEAAAVERVGDGARAVVAGVVPRPVPAAVAVRLVGDLVRGGEPVLAVRAGPQPDLREVAL